MAKETSDFRPVGSSGDEIKRVTVDVPSLGIEDMGSDWVRKQEKVAKAETKKDETREKLAAQKASVERRKEAMTKKAHARKRLEEEGASKEALFAFEMAYDKRFWGDKKGSIGEKMGELGLANKRLNKDNWNTVHTAMMKNEKYADAYKAVTPLIKPGEPVPEENKEPEVVASTDIPLVDLVTGEEINPEVAEKEKKEESKFGLDPDEEAVFMEAWAIMHPHMYENWDESVDELLRSYVERQKSEGRDTKNEGEWLISMKEVDDVDYTQTVDPVALRADKLNPKNRLIDELGVSESLAGNILFELDKLKKSSVDSRYALDLNNPTHMARLRKIVDIHENSEAAYTWDNLIYHFGKALEEAQKGGLDEKASQNLVAALFLEKGNEGFNVNRSKDSGLMANLIKKAPDGTSSQEAWAGLIEGKMDDSVRVTSVSTRKPR